ncbi:MAG: recombination-associated protein RdgC [Pseudomonadota bacterium]|uniref:Recombination-associated protein RdgC n=1 Tax=Candidatus Desulfatibia profunda TaxID=2841695 RepID=A0A8J6TLN9_9BACT|nr:recombination-associated protein RdgC [Candidatus Desulfatibia profunda]MBL7180653.1 recombination-associated protein RdgC [Desulfobacterales bacterium]
MGILSSSVSVTRYRVQGDLKKPVIETVAAALKSNSISEIDDHVSEITAGWTSFANPYQPNFEGSSFVFGTYLVFSLRIDKKSIPSKIIQKHYTIQMAKKLKETGREYLSKNEKKMLKDHVINVLSLRIPATPNLYDVLWNYEEGSLWFFSNLKAANEQFESLFSRSLKLSLIRLFPYTTAQLVSGLSPSQLDVLAKLSPAKLTE